MNAGFTVDIRYSTSIGSGLVACDEAQRSAVCPHCQGSFIRRRADQRYCMKPECQKASKGKYWRAKDGLK